jgi:endonuclease G
MAMPGRITLLLTLLGPAALGGAALADTKATDPNSCKKLWSEIGLPAPNPGGPHTTRICHLGYITGHNDSTKTPDWVIERLTPDIVNGEGTREDQDFRADPAITPAEKAAVPGDYDGSGFDKGHNAPAADFHGNQDALDDTFFFSNAVPQVGKGFNRSIWRSLETLVRKLVTGERPELYVITGPVPPDSKPIRISSKTDVCKSSIELPVPSQQSICQDNNEDKKAQCKAGVAVPAGMFKIVYDPTSRHAFAVLFENFDHTGRYASGRTFDYIQAHKIGIGTIEDLTGLTFFPALSAREKRQMTANCTDVKFR